MALFSNFRFAFVVFNSPEALEEKMKAKNETELDGNKISLDYTDERSSYVPREKKPKPPSKSK